MLPRKFANYGAKMNKTFKFALAVVLGVGLVVPAMAQDNFPDVPDNHWAYGALEDLKGTVLFGYPDGLYRGNRPMSRYEFAVAVHKLWMNMSDNMSGMQEQIDALEAMIKNNQGGGDQGLRAALDALKRQVDGMAGWKTDIDNFKKLASEFEKELAGMGVKVDGMMADIADLDARVSALEKGGRGGGINISGDASLLVLGGHSNDGDFGLTPDGRPVGVGNLGNPVGATRDLSVGHELALNLSGNADEGVSYNGTIVLGNMFDLLGDLNTRNQGANFANEPDFDSYIYNLSVNFNSALAGQGFNAEVGRVNHSVGKYLWKRSDYTPYFKNARWDNGKFVFDGGILNFNFGAAKVSVFGGRNSGVEAMDGGELNPMGMNMGNPAAAVDTTLGLEAMFGIGEEGNVKLAYIIHDSDVNPTTNGGINRLSVMGAEVNFGFGPVDFMGKFSQSVAGAGDNSVIDTDNTAWEAALGWDNEKWGLMGGYKTIEPNFMAYGSWERIGTLWSPTNVEGFFGTLWFEPSDKMSLWLSGQMMEPNQAGGLVGADDATALKAGINFALADNWGFMASFENVQWDYAAGTDPVQRWFNVGFDYKLGANSSVLINYLYSDVDFKGRQAAFGFANTRYRGGLIGTQLSIKMPRTRSRSATPAT